MNIKLPEYGYTPNNFIALVDATGMSNTGFMNRFKIKHSTFYKWCAGDRSMAHKTWEALLTEVQTYIASTQKKTNVTFKSKGVSPVDFKLDEISFDTGRAEQCAALATLEVTHEGRSNKVKVYVLEEDSQKKYEIIIDGVKGINAIRNTILKTLSVDFKNSTNAEFLLDIDRNSSATHSAILSEIESAINIKSRVRK